MKSKNKIINLIITFCLFFFPLTTLSAYDIVGDGVCKNCSHTPYYTNKYENNGSYHERDITNVNQFCQGGPCQQGSQRLFCIEPTKTHASSGYQRTNDYDTAKDELDSKWKAGFAHQEDLKKVLSCWEENKSSLVATQAIIWEIMAEERYNINEKNILSGNYTPYMSDGKTFQSKTGKNPISGVLCPNGVNKDTSSLCKKYQATLRCAARFNVVPSFSNQLDSKAKATPLKLTNYDDETQTFSRTFTHNGLDSKLLKYYKIPSVEGLTITKTDTSITISTKNEIASQSAAKRVTLNYALKDNGADNLNDDPDYFYYKSAYQTLMQGSSKLTSYMYVYTGEKPTYQLRVQKKDEYQKPVSGVKFNVYSDASLKTKIGTTTATDQNGWAYLTGINKIGKYYIQEADTPDGYITNKKVVNVTVKGENRTGSNSYATASEVFVNNFMHLNLSKRTIDANGNVIEIPDYSDNSCTGNYSGPVFTLKKENKDICVVEISAGKYRVAESCSEANATNEIKTCTGKFDIEGIKSGCYELTETKAPNGYTLPANPSQKICVTKGESSTATAVYNGVSGVIFNKITENGQLLDGGKYALQIKVNGIYKDMLLKHDAGVYYSYVESLNDQTDGVTYILETTNGTINVRNLPPGEYRFVEKEAPEGYDAIKDKDSNATFTISDKGIFGSDGKPVTDYYQVKLVNQKVRLEGSYDSAELIVTIITGRKVANYAIIISGLILLLIIFVILRKILKK